MEIDVPDGLAPRSASGYGGRRIGYDGRDD
jgi:hypothetical protein